MIVAIIHTRLRGSKKGKEFVGKKIKEEGTYRLMDRMSAGMLPLLPTSRNATH